MKIGHYFVLSFILFHATAFGQEAEPRFVKGIGFSFVKGIPTGAFAETTINSQGSGEGSGFAQDGYGAELSYLLMEPSGKSGLTGTISFVSFGYNIQPELERMKQQGILYQWYAETNNWNTYSFRLGGYANILNTAKFKFGPRIQLGGMLVGVQSKAFVPYGNGMDSLRVDHATKTSLGFTFLLGVQLQWQLSQVLMVSLTGDYIDSKPTIDYSVSLVDDGVVTAVNNNSYSQPISAYLINVGLVYLLRKKPGGSRD